MEAEGSGSGYVEDYVAALLGGNMELVKMCYTKDRYPSLESAEFAITRRKTRTSKLLRVYRCDCCGGHHLTSQPLAIPAAV